MTKPSIFRYEGHNYLVPFLIISSLFFMWGFAHGILEVLNPHFQESFHISKAMSALTQTAVYGAYFLMALPAGWIIRKWGYRRGVITGLVLFGIGALMFIPGSRINSFYFFVLSLFVIGCGLTCLETSANPYTTVLGHPDKAESRINLSQSLNGIGWIVGPLVGGQLLFSGVNIAIPYALVGIFVLSVALVLLVCAILTFVATLIVVVCSGTLSHCVFRPVSGREHHVSDYLLAGIEGCGDKDQTCLFIAYHDDSGWCGCSCNHGVYSGYYGQYGDCLSYTVSMLWGDWRVCTFETLCLPLAKGRFQAFCSW